MSELDRAAETEIGATPEAVWEGITSPELTRRYVFGCSIESEWHDGAPWRYHSGGQSAVEGTVLEARPPHLLRLTARDVYDPAGRDEPPHRITWQVEPLPGGRSQVRLTFDGFETEVGSRRHQEDAGMMVEGLRNVVDPEAAAALRRLDEIGQVEVHPLTPERRDDYLDLFDNRAFKDNPSWSGCYCFNFRFAGDPAEAAERTGADNRRDMAEAISARRAHGLLAYAGGKAVGWCSASPKAEMPELLRREWMPPPTEERVGIIGCLVIAPQYRRHGVARRLIEAAGDYLAGIGCDVVEAYPLREFDNDGHGFYGPLAVYQELGYETFREHPQRLVVRKRALRDRERR